jgi:hypothetical protein
MVSERTACDRLVRRLVSYGEPEGVCGRLAMGMFLLRRVYEEYLSGNATRDLPVFWWTGRGGGYRDAGRRNDCRRSWRKERNDAPHKSKDTLFTSIARAARDGAPQLRNLALPPPLLTTNRSWDRA